MRDIDAHLVQSRLEKLTDVRLLGRGGQKVVFYGNHEECGPIVIKLALGSQPNERVQREIDVATKCVIPHTARLFEWGTFEHDGDPVTYIIEEFIPGITLRQELEDNKTLSISTALNLVKTLLETAVSMEQQGLVHRDIKPENIMVCPNGSFKILDFGIARHLAKTSLTPTEANFGPHTAGYAAPEQFRNLKKKIDIRTDLFAIGVVTYEALSGKHPFKEGARDVLDILGRTEQVIPPALSIPEDTDGQLSSFISVLMSKYPSRRPPSAKDAVDWFESIRTTMNVKMP